LSVLQTAGCSITGQTARIAPADKKLYALRDVTGTVPSIPLIAASIMSKKLAEGAANLVLDVKWGSGAFMKTRENAEQLARTMVAIGSRMNRGMTAIITDMNQPLGRTASNSLEVLETLETLQGHGPADLLEVTLTLCAAMLILAGVADDQDRARQTLLAQLESGAAFDKFGEMVALHGGDRRVLENPDQLPTAPLIQPVEAAADGYIRKMDADAIGRICLLLGAGRAAVTDRVDPRVGVSGMLKIGDAVTKGQPLMQLHAADKPRLEQALALANQAVEIGEHPVAPLDLIVKTIPLESAP